MKSCTPNRTSLILFYPFVLTTLASAVQAQDRDIEEIIVIGDTVGELGLNSESATASRLGLTVMETPAAIYDWLCEPSCGVRGRPFRSNVLSPEKVGNANAQQGLCDVQITMHSIEDEQKFIPGYSERFRYDQASINQSVASTLSEPSVLMLLGFGLIGIALTRKYTTRTVPATGKPNADCI